MGDGQAVPCGEEAIDQLHQGLGKGLNLVRNLREFYFSEEVSFHGFNVEFDLLNCTGKGEVLEKSELYFAFKVAN